jgi:hypothetical protein
MRATAIATPAFAEAARGHHAVATGRVGELLAMTLNERENGSWCPVLLARWGKAGRPSTNTPRDRLNSHGDQAC